MSDSAMKRWMGGRRTAWDMDALQRLQYATDRLLSEKRVVLERLTGGYVLESK